MFIGRYKLNIRLIPESAYGQNMRSAMSSYEWRKLSEYVRSVEVCAGCWERYKKKDLEAHEEWLWNSSGKQKLRRIVPLCKACHHTVHIGRASANNEYEQACKHYMRVRHVSRGKFSMLVNEEWKRQRRRSHMKWTLATSPEEAWEIARRDKQIIEKQLQKRPPSNK